MLSSTATFVLLGLVGLLFGSWLIRKGLWGDRLRGTRRCPKCWYVMAATPGMRCSECGHEATSEFELHRSRWSWPALLVGAGMALAAPVLFTVQHAREAGWVYFLLPTYKVQWEWTVNEFVVQCLETRNPDAADWNRFMRVCRDGETVFTFDGQYMDVGVEVGDTGITRGRGDDINGDGEPDLIITNDSGGTGCFAETIVLGLGNANGSALGVQARLPNCGRFEDLDHDGILEFVAWDRTFAYRWTSGAGSPYPRVILEWRGFDGYVPAPDRMTGPAPFLADLDSDIRAKIDACRPDAQWWCRTELVLKAMLDLIYSGNSRMAWQVFDRHWESDGGWSERESFRREFKDALRESPFWTTVVTLNREDPELFAVSSPAVASESMPLK